MPRLLRPLFTCGGYLPRTLNTEARQQADLPDISNSFDPAREPDLRGMFEAFLVGMEGVGRTAPNPAVGCAVFKEGRLLSKGATETYRLRHAERVAVEALKDPAELKGATAYVTLEPCAHIGHQPACSQMLANTQLSRVVIACEDPNPKVNGAGKQQLLNAGKEVVVGPLGPEAKAWNLPFFFDQLLNRPLVVAKWAQTLDGCLCDDELASQWITGPAARSYTHWLRQKYDVILVGAGTILRDAPSLTARDCALPHNQQPMRAFFDPNGRILREATLTEQQQMNLKILLPGTPFIYVTKSNTIVTSAWANTFLQNAIVVHCEALETLAHVLQNHPDVQNALGKPLQSLMIEGGPRLLTAALERDLIDLAHIFIAPTFLGGTRGRVAPAPLSLAKAKHWTLVAQERLGQDVLVECMPSQHSRRLFE